MRLKAHEWRRIRRFLDEHPGINVGNPCKCKKFVEAVPCGAVDEPKWRTVDGCSPAAGAPTPVAAVAHVRAYASCPCLLEWRERGHERQHLGHRKGKLHQQAALLYGGAIAVFDIYGSFFALPEAFLAR